MIEKSFVFLIVAAVALYLGRRFLRQAQGSGQGCGGGCRGCGGKASPAPCSPPIHREKRGIGTGQSDDRIDRAPPGQ